LTLCRAAAHSDDARDLAVAEWIATTPWIEREEPIGASASGSVSFEGEEDEYRAYRATG
jgi:hypothetical protein